MPTAVTNEYLRKEFNNFELNEDLGNLIEELKYSTLIVPIDNENEGCIMVSMNDEEYIPIFTDIHEYQKVNFNESVHPKAFDFNFYLEILKMDELGLTRLHIVGLTTSVHWYFHLWTKSSLPTEMSTFIHSLSICHSSLISSLKKTLLE